MTHKISYSWYVDIRSGGSSGYIANLRQGLIDTAAEANGAPPIIVEHPERESWMKSTMEITAKTLEQHTSWFSKIDEIELSPRQLEKLLAGNTKSVHVHTVTDALMSIQSLRAHGMQSIPIFFTNHSPEAFSKEFSDLWRERGFDAAKVDELQSAVRAVELRAFELSDAWIFPSIESMEGYHETLPGFTELSKKKDTRFILTGAVGLKSNLDRYQARAEFGLLGKRVLAFIGRHNTVKGYNFLQSACMRLLTQDPDLIVLVAGKPEPFSPPIHPRWIELGWHPNPEHVLTAADLLVLPNERTFFDLVLLEALSLGTPIVASASGGNRTAKFINYDGMLLYRRGSFEEFSTQISAVLNKNSYRQYLRRASKQTFERYFTHIDFARRYRQLVFALRSDYALYNSRGNEL
jgi:glycosyltransferase involved in cell wall biosynthesis